MLAASSRPIQGCTSSCSEMALVTSSVSKDCCYSSRNVRLSPSPNFLFTYHHVNNLPHSVSVAECDIGLNKDCTCIDVKNGLSNLIESVNSNCLQSADKSVVIADDSTKLNIDHESLINRSGVQDTKNNTLAQHIDIPPLDIPPVEVCVRPKYGDTIIGLPETVTKRVPGVFQPGFEHAESEPKPPKKRKWKRIEAEEIGFRLTLFPRLPVANNDKREDEMEWKVFHQLDKEEVEMEKRLLEAQQLLLLQGQGLRQREKCLRRDQDRRVEKAHKQIKSKNLTTVLNNKGRKLLYIHFRLYKRFTFLHCESHSHPNLRLPPRHPGVCLEAARAACKAQVRAARLFEDSALSHAASPQSLAHALHGDNLAASDLPLDIAAFMISLQHREMMPEDYEMLLLLDEGVAPKTVASDMIEAFETDTVDSSTAGVAVCSVCMEVYELGQKRKFLPCSHVFHEKCIDMWLSNSSQNCPLDGLPVGFS